MDRCSELGQASAAAQNMGIPHEVRAQHVSGLDSRESGLSSSGCIQEAFYALYDTL